MRTLQPEPDGPTPAELAAAILGDLGFTAADIEECMAEPGASVTVHAGEPVPQPRWRQGNGAGLSALISDDFDAYAEGRLDVGEVNCALCQCAPCRCPAFGTGAYFRLLDQRHGRTS